MTPTLVGAVLRGRTEVQVIRIITIEREFGSGGGVIAAAIAARLGWTLWDQLLTDEIARRMDCDRQTVEAHEERPDPAYYRLFTAFLRGTFEGSVNAPRLKLVDTKCVSEVAQTIQLEAAQAGNVVIVGRGSAYFLGDRGDAFHVFIYAPFAQKGAAPAIEPAAASGTRTRWRRPSTATAPPSSSASSISSGRRFTGST